MTIPMPDGYGSIRPSVTMPYTVRGGETEEQAHERAFKVAQWLFMKDVHRLAEGFKAALYDPAAFAAHFLASNPTPPQDVPAAV